MSLGPRDDAVRIRSRYEYTPRMRVQQVEQQVIIKDGRVAFNDRREERTTTTNERASIAGGVYEASGLFLGLYFLCDVFFFTVVGGY